MDASRLFVPDQGKDHIEIAAKAYLSRKDIRELIVPNSIDSIGDWAFAFMKNLEVLWIPKKKMHLGRDILKDCEKLHDIFCYDYVQDGNNQQIKGVESATRDWNIRFSSESTPESRLFASAAMKLGVNGFLIPEEMGLDAWFCKLDEYLLTWIREDDQKGFVPSWFGGEEDYLEDSTNSKAAYQKGQVQKKITVLFQRLDYAIYLEQIIKEQYIDYLVEKMTEQKDFSENEVWSFLLEHADYPAYSRMMLQTGKICKTQILAAIEQLDGTYPELLAQLLSYATDNMQGRDEQFDDFNI